MDWGTHFVLSKSFGNQGGGGGGGGITEKEINFRDYDGTIVGSYTANEFATLTAMPDNPDHSGDEVPLTSQGWNWTLEDAKIYVAKYGSLEVEQMYMPMDGKTHIFIYIDPSTPSNRMTFTLYFGQSVSNGVLVNWGDGSEPETFAGTSVSLHNHTYATSGEYHITLSVNSGLLTLAGSGYSETSGTSIFGNRNNSNKYNYGRIRNVYLGASITSIGSSTFAYCLGLNSITLPYGVTDIGEYAFCYCRSLTSITIPDGVTSIKRNTFYMCGSLSGIIIPNSVTSIGQIAFGSCYSLTSVTIPDGVTSIGQDAFSSCYSLTSVIIPDSVTSIGQTAFNSCYSLTSVTIPGGVTSISSGAFQYCVNLTSVTIPSGITSIESASYNACQGLTSLTIPRGVTSIKNSAFANCYGVSVINMLPATPPTLANTNAFTGIASDCIIYVPYSEDHSILEAYKTATNWSTYASQMQEVPQS